MPVNYDHIDTAVCQVYCIEPALLTARNRKEKVALARFTAMYIRHMGGVDTNRIAVQYQRDEYTVRSAIRTARGLLEVDKEFRERYNHITELLNDKKAPFSPELVRPGAKVWTRADSNGKVLQGTIVDVCDNLFQCGSFENPDYYSLNRIGDGRISEAYESSLDVVYIEALKNTPIAGLTPG